MLKTPSVTTSRAPAPASRGERAFEGIGVAVRVRRGPRAGEAAAVVEARVGEAIADDDVIAREKARQGADVRGVARRKDERGLATVEGRHDVLQLAEPAVRAGEERGARRAGAGAVERAPDRGENARMQMQAKVAVGVEAGHPLRPQT